MNKGNQKPPVTAKFFLMLLLKRSDHYSYFGDIEEMYNDLAERKGLFQASIWYWSQALKLIPGFIADSIQGSITMFKSYFKTGIRNLLRYKFYSFINIFGFAIGITACILIFLVADYVLSYDSFHEKIDEIYYACREEIVPNGIHVSYVTQLRLIEEILSGYPEVESGTRIYGTYPVVQYKDLKFNTEIAYVDTSFFNIFSFRILKGNPADACKIRNNVIITENIATKFFGDEDPIGKILNVDYDKDFIVGGVIENIPGNSSFDFDILAPFENAWELQEVRRWDSFSSSFLRTFLIIDDPETAEALERKFSSIIEKNLGEDAAKEQRIGLIPFSDYHASRSNDNKYAQALLAMGASVLIIAILNFVNLSTAKSFYRSREIGMRKVLGAVRFQLIKQIILESVIIAVIASLGAVISVGLIVPVLKDFTGLDIMFNPLGSVSNLIYLVIFILTIGIISGLIPALYLSKNRPVESLKGSLKAGDLGITLRNIFVLVQFTFSVILIISSTVIWSQLDYMRNFDIGLDKNNVIALRMSVRDFPETENALMRFETFKNEITQGENIQNASFSMNVPGVNNTTRRTNAVPAGSSKENEITANILVVDEQYFETYRISFFKGRSFAEDYIVDRQGRTIVINKTMYNLIGDSEIIGKSIKVYGNLHEVVGVINDYNFRSLHDEVNPLVFFCGSKNNIYPNHLSIRTDGSNMNEVLKFIQNKWGELFPDKDFEYFFVEERFDSLYDTDQKLGSVSGWFSVISIALASLGLYGLFSFTVVKRTKEVGVRKVLGATVSQVVGTLSGKFVLLILASNIVAWPAAYYIMNKWLQLFAFRMDIDIVHFLVSGSIAFTIAFLTIFLQAARASLSDPVDALRYE